MGLDSHAFEKIVSKLADSFNSPIGTSCTKVMIWKVRIATATHESIGRESFGLKSLAQLDEVISALCLRTKVNQSIAQPYDDLRVLIRGFTLVQNFFAATKQSSLVLVES